MPDDPKGALAEGAGSSAAGAASGTPPAATTDAGKSETAEERATRLEAELKRSRELELSRKDELEKARRRTEELEAQAARQAPAAGAAAASNPLDAAILQAQENINSLNQELAKFPDDPVVKSQIFQMRVTAAQLLKIKQDEAALTEAQRAEPTFTADATFGARAKQLWLSGQAATPEAALLMARGEKYQAPDAAAEAQRRADAEAAERMKDKPSTGTGGGAGASAQTTAMAGSEYLRRVRAGDGALARENDAGRLQIDWTR